MSDIFVKGLIVTGLGLAGVFLVLSLFFGVIKLLQKVTVKPEKD